jgi:hypothetical protein
MPPGGPAASMGSISPGGSPGAPAGIPAVTPGGGNELSGMRNLFYEIGENTVTIRHVRASIFKPRASPISLLISRIFGRPRDKKRSRQIGMKSLALGLQACDRKIASGLSQKAAGGKGAAASLPARSCRTEFSNTTNRWSCLCESSRCLRCRLAHRCRRS